MTGKGGLLQMFPQHGAQVIRGNLQRAYLNFQALPGLVRILPYLRASETLIFFGGAPGDDLLCTTLLVEQAARGRRPCGVMTRHAAIFQGNPGVAKAIPFAPHSLGLVRALGKSVIELSYCERNEALDQDTSPDEHILSILCRKASVSGEISLRPHIFLTPDEIKKGAIGDRQVVVQSGATGANFPMRNKEWYPERFQSVVDALRDKFQVIQLGAESDPPLKGVLDLRGKTTMREAGAVLANSMVFVGLVGFLMHLARAVDCRSVIVYGGRERPWQSGYICNTNLTGDTACSPCWRWNTCDYDRECMKLISPDAVISGAFEQLEKFGTPLECEKALI